MEKLRETSHGALARRQLVQWLRAFGHTTGPVGKHVNEAADAIDDLRRFILERFNAISDICNTTLLYNHMTRDEVVDAFYETLRKIDAVANYSSIMDEDEDDGKA
jgi:hypothetical protein